MNEKSKAVKQRTLAIKDNITTTSSPTTCASAFLQDFKSPYAAPIVEQLYDSSIVVGKTNMDEFGMGSHSTNSALGPVCNVAPFENYSAGGSSGGSAVAVASNEAESALGTDTGGSVRLPAAYTGLMGFKPSYGRISRRGVIPYANSLDTVGIIGSKSEDIEQLLRSIDSHDPRDPTSMTPQTRKRVLLATREHGEGDRVGNSDPFRCRSDKAAQPNVSLRIGVPLEYNIEELSCGVRSAWQMTLERLQDEGHEIVPISLPTTKHALSAYYIIAPAEASSNLAKYDGVRFGSRCDFNDNAQGVLYSNTRGSGFGDEVKKRILLGSYTLSSTAMDNYFIQAQKVRRLVQRDFDRVFALHNVLQPEQQFDLSTMDDHIVLSNKLGPAQVDVIVCPTAPTLPPSLQHVTSSQDSLDTYMNDVFTVPASLAGLPAISVAVPVDEGLRYPSMVPFAGMQVIGQYGDDARVIEMGKCIEKIMRPTVKGEPQRIQADIDPATEWHKAHSSQAPKGQRVGF